MRCPKCQYISFDEGQRCRNCGYDFSLTEPEPEVDLDLRMRGGEAQGPLDDYDLGARERPPATPALAGRRAATPAAAFELPLFTGDDDAPLVTPPAVPRPPLSVRRAPITPRAPFDETDPPGDAPQALPPPRRRPAPAPVPEHADNASPGDVAPAGARLLAAAVDLAIVGGIDLAVIYFTLRATGLDVGDAGALPFVPLAAFLLLLNGGYAVMFTAAVGQTIGKMLAGIRVVPESSAGPAARIPLPTAIVREAACLLSLLPAGLGFFLAFMRPDGRALHDTLADTRVVRA